MTVERLFKMRRVTNTIAAVPNIVAARAHPKATAIDEIDSLGPSSGR